MQHAVAEPDTGAGVVSAAPQNRPEPAASAFPQRRPRRGPDPLWLAAPGIAFLLLFLVGPAAQVLSFSILDKVTGSLTASAFVRIVTGGPYLGVLSTTFSVAAWTTLLCIVLGYPLAYWVCRLPPRRQPIAALFVLLPFWTSALIKNFSWLVLLGRNGIVAHAMAAIGMPGGDHLLFNRATVVFAMTHTLLPLAVVTMLPVMNQIDQRLPKAALTLGASRAQAFWQVYFQLSMRGVAAAGLLVLVASLGFFITPALLGGPPDTMIGQLIILQINELQNWQLGSALATILLVSALATCVAYDLLFGLSSLSGDGKARRSRDGLFRRAGLGVARFVGAVSTSVEEFWAANVPGLRGGILLSAYAWAVLAALLVPIAAFVPMAFTASAFLSFPPPALSLRWFDQFAASSLWIGAMIRSFGIGFATAAIAVTICALAAIGVARTRSRLGRVAFLMFLAPMMIPSIVVAIGLFFVFARISLVATDLGIIIGHTVIATPIVFVILLATFKGHDWNLDAAAATLGAGRKQRFLMVTLPLVRNGLAVAFVTGFLQSFEELTVALFVGGGTKTTLPKQMWDGIVLQVTPVIAAASVVVLSVVIVLFAAAEYVRARRVKRGRTQG